MRIAELFKLTIRGVSAGIRYTVAPNERVALRLDVAKGEGQTRGYISVGEAF